MKRKICVLFGSLNPGGGAERVTAVLAHALGDKFKDNVALCLPDKPLAHIIEEYKEYLNNIPIELSPCNTFRSFNVVGKKVFLACHEFYVDLKHRYDIIVNTSGIFSPLSDVGDVIYVHGLKQMRERALKQHTRGIRRVYGFALNALGFLLKSCLRNRGAPPKMILANSNYTLSYVTKLLNVHDSILDVLYPPVNSREIMKRISFDMERKDLAVTICRISPEKNLLIIPEVARRLGQYKFVIAGRIRNQKYLRAILEKIKSYNLSNVEVVTNITEETKIELLQTAKLFFHPAQYDAFGISIVEGMSAGLTPITHNSGGPQEFIPAEQRFTEIDDVANKISFSMRSWTKDVALENARNSLRFDTREFEEKTQNLFERLHLML
jgi:glycosyltransferase involved in cell wall biosynthesis